MEINLTNTVWPMCVLRCNEALKRLHPGEELTITLAEPELLDNILPLINNKPGLQSIKEHKHGSYHIIVRRMTADQDGSGEQENASQTVKAGETLHEN